MPKGERHQVLFLLTSRIRKPDRVTPEHLDTLTPTNKAERPLEMQRSPMDAQPGVLGAGLADWKITCPASPQAPNHFHDIVCL